MLTYNEAKALFETAKDKTKGKPLANNTRLVKTTNGYGIKLHNTIVVSIMPDNTYMLNNGGFQTKTTKDRINSYSPVRVYQHKHQWYIQSEFGQYDSQGKRIEYHNGMVVKPSQQGAIQCS